jgi:hypothetical protein
VEENRLSTPFSVVEDLLWGLVGGAVLLIFRRASSHAAKAVMNTPANKQPKASPTARPVESPLELPDADDVADWVPELAAVVCMSLVAVDDST